MARRYEFNARVIVEGDLSTIEAEEEADDLAREVNKGDGPHLFIMAEPPEVDEGDIE